jgi:hypothetical protein
VEEECEGEVDVDAEGMMAGVWIDDEGLECEG